MLAAFDVARDPWSLREAGTVLLNVIPDNSSALFVRTFWRRPCLSQPCLGGVRSLFPLHLERRILDGPTRIDRQHRQVRAEMRVLAREPTTPGSTDSDAWDGARTLLRW